MEIVREMILEDQISLVLIVLWVMQLSDIYLTPLPNNLITFCAKDKCELVFCTS